MMSKRHNRRPDIIHENRLTPPRVRRHFLAPVGFMEIPVGYARKDLSTGETRGKPFLAYQIRRSAGNMHAKIAPVPGNINISTH